MIPELVHLVDDGTTWRPTILAAGDPETPAALRALAASGAIAVVADTLERQLRELVDASEPALDLEPEDIAGRARDHLAGVPAARYGVWVHYPWSKRLVHTLPEDEFRRLRASRNRNKITDGEAAILGRATIGVVGLSVGQATALTLALEGIGGTLRLADFDRLDLSNLNRLRGGVHQLGINKAVLAARAIFELDPFARVSIFPDGITDDNIDDFLCGGGGLQLLIEECDDLYMKIRLRERARAARIPVLMETSDRGLLDVERFDEEPTRPLLHGLVGNLDAEELRGLDTYDKVPIVLRLLGEDAISPRLAASMVEIKSTLKSWPQLASAVALGGAICADTARRILLGELHGSGRHYVDLTRLIEPARDGAATTTASAPAPAPSGPPPVVPALPAPHPRRAAPPAEAALDLAQVRRLVELAAMAPSGGNCQPWRFVWRGGRLRILHDVDRSRSLLDFEHAASYLALGAAAENLVLGAAGLGLAAHLAPFPEPRDATVVCDVTFAAGGALRPDDARLLEEIPRRATNRRLSARVALPPDDAAALRAAAAARGATLQLVDDPAALDVMGRLLGRGDRVRFLSRTMHREMMGELRWSTEDAVRTGDGIDVATLELTATDLAGMRLTSSWAVMDLVGRIGGGRALEKPSRKAVAAAAALGLVTVAGTAPRDAFEGGRALQRVWLEAGARGWAYQPMTAITYLFARLERGGAADLTPREQGELDALRRAYREVFDVPAGWSEIMLFRLARAAPPTARALRRPVDDILDAGA